MNIFAKKSLGQHFLNSPHVLDQILKAANIQTGETVLEIGPGTGVLTNALLKANANVIAVEKDDRSYELIEEKFSPAIGTGQLKLIRGDILELSGKNIFKNNDQSADSSAQTPPFALVANIPYYITGAILEKFLEKGPQPNRMVLLVQKEVAERIVARDGKESILSISVKAFGKPSIVATVPPGAFVPPPTVDSAIIAINDVSLDLFARAKVEISAFFAFVKAGFAHKRKVLIRNLEAVSSRETLMAAWSGLRFDEKVRAEDMTLDQWFKLIGFCTELH